MLNGLIILLNREKEINKRNSKIISGQLKGEPAILSSNEIQGGNLNNSILNTQKEESKDEVGTKGESLMVNNHSQMNMYEDKGKNSSILCEVNKIYTCN